MNSQGRKTGLWAYGSLYGNPLQPSQQKRKNDGIPIEQYAIEYGKGVGFGKAELQAPTVFCPLSLVNLTAMYLYICQLRPSTLDPDSPFTLLTPRLSTGVHATDQVQMRFAECENLDIGWKMTGSHLSCYLSCEYDDLKKHRHNRLKDHVQQWSEIWDLISW